MAGPAAERSSPSADGPRQSVESSGSPWQTVGSHDSPRQSVGPCDNPRQSVGSPDSLRQSVGSADCPRQSVRSPDSPRQTVGSADCPRQSVRSPDSPRQTVGSPDSPQQTVGSYDSPRQTVASCDSSRQSVGPCDAPRETVGSLDCPRQTVGAPFPPPGASGSPLLVAVSAGWRAAGGQSASRTVRLASPNSARGRVQDWAEPATCVLLEREKGSGDGLQEGSGDDSPPVEGSGDDSPPVEGSGDGRRPGLTLTVADGQPLAIAEISLLSELGRCELFGDHGEYLATADAELEEEVDGTRVMSLQYRCRPPVTQLSLQCVSAASRRQLWLYGMEVTLQPSAARPARPAFSLPSVLARLEAQGAALPEGADALRAALTARGGGPPTVAALAAALGSGGLLAGLGGGGVSRTRTAMGSGGAVKSDTDTSDKCGAGVRMKSEAGGAVPSVGVEAALARCAVEIEDRLWRRIGPRLESIERKQDQIMERLDRLGVGGTDCQERTMH